MSEQAATTDSVEEAERLFKIANDIAVILNEATTHGTLHRLKNVAIYFDEAELRSMLAAFAAARREKRMRAAAQAFIDKYAECEPAVNSAFAFQQNHGVTYHGPNYGKELTALRAALQEKKDG